MFPFLTFGETKLYMTGIGIVISLISFIVIAFYLARKFKQNFWPFFYWLPLFIILCYILGAYTQFILSVGRFPSNHKEILMLLTPYGYKFHFTGILLGLTIAIVRFMKKQKRYENKRIRIDILFISLALAIIPLGIFLLLGDHFIGKPTDSLIGIKPLHPDSELNKFSSVYPIGLFLSIGSLLVLLLFAILKKVKQRFGLGLLGFIGLLIMTNIVLLFQQYPRYGIVVLGGTSFDIKQHMSFLMIMLCIYTYHKRQRHQ